MRTVRAVRIILLNTAAVDASPCHAAFAAAIPAFAVVKIVLVMVVRV
jgi:hypothetical protein